MKTRICRNVSEAPFFFPLINHQLFEALQIEWCRSRARANRWSEEVTLLTEEMRRVLAFFASKANWWHDRASKRDGVRDDLCEGLSAYATRQASLYHALKIACKVNWIGVQKRVLEGEEKRLQHVGVSVGTVGTTK
jgi:hypothetical protein